MKWIKAFSENARRVVSPSLIFGFRKQCQAPECHLRSLAAKQELINGPNKLATGISIDEAPLVYRQTLQTLKNQISYPSWRSRSNNLKQSGLSEGTLKR